MAAAVAVAIGAAIYLSAEKLHDRIERKRSFKAQEALERGFVEELSTIDDTAGHHNNEHVPIYQKERVPSYHTEDQHSAFHTNTPSVCHHGFRWKSTFKAAQISGWSSRRDVPRITLQKWWEHILISKAFCINLEFLISWTIQHVLALHNIYNTDIYHLFSKVPDQYV